MSYRELIARSWRDNVLYSVLLELTYGCNLDCFFCYNDLALRGRALSVDQYCRLLEELRDLGVLNVALSGGEPLAHPDFLSIGAKARELGFVVRIKSNGHSLRGRMAERIRSEIDPFLIEVSLHGGCARTHDRQTRISGSFDRLIANLEAAKDLGLRIKINCTLTAWNELEVAAILDLADRLDLPLQIDPEVTIRDDGDRRPLDISVSRAGVERLFQLQLERVARQSVEIGRVDSGPPAAKSGQAIGQEQKHCGAGSSGLAVDPFGNVYPCVQWRRAVGNLHQSSITELWQGGGFAGFRELTAAAGEMVRSHGQRGQLMAFCPGTAEARTGNALSVYDDAARRADVLMELQQTPARRPLRVLG